MNSYPAKNRVKDHRPALAPLVDASQPVRNVDRYTKIRHYFDRSAVRLAFSPATRNETDEHVQPTKNP